jgi:hypothetical protein
MAKEELLQFDGLVTEILPDRNPPRELSREVIETAIKNQGFQLWRMSKKDE